MSKEKPIKIDTEDIVNWDFYIERPVHKQPNRSRGRLRHFKPSTNLYFNHFILRRIIDGDTFEGDVDWGMNLWTKEVDIRFLEFNTPERFTPLGKEIKAKLEEKLPSGTRLIIHTRTNKKDSFGRLLADVYYQDEGITDWDFLKAYKLK